MLRAFIPKMRRLICNNYNCNYNYYLWRIVSRLCVSCGGSSPACVLVPRELSIVCACVCVCVCVCSCGGLSPAVVSFVVCRCWRFGYTADVVFFYVGGLSTAVFICVCVCVCACVCSRLVSHCFCTTTCFSIYTAGVFFGAGGLSTACMCFGAGGMSTASRHCSQLASHVFSVSGLSIARVFVPC